MFSSDGLFLDYIGASYLPHVNYAIAASLLLLPILFLKLLHRINPTKTFQFSMLIGSLVLWALFFTVQYYETKNLPSWIWVFYNIWCNAFYLAYLTCFWTFVDLFYDLQDAKRIYALFIASSLIGAAVAGGVIDLFFKTIGFSGTLLANAVLMLGVIVLIWQTTQRHKPFYDEHSEQQVLQQPIQLKHLIKAIVNSKYTLYLLAAIILMQTTIYIGELAYTKGLQELLTSGDPDQEKLTLTLFIGKCNGWVYLSNALIGLVLYSRIIRVFSINNVALFPALFFLLLFLGWSFKNNLFFAIMGVVAVEGVACSFDDNNYNLLIKAVPQRINHPVRIACDWIFKPLGIIIASTLALTVDIGYAIIGTVVALASFLCILLVRKYYSKSIYINLSDNTICFAKNLNEIFSTAHKWKIKKLIKVIVEKIEALSAKQKQLFFELICKLAQPQYLKILAQHLDSASVENKVFFLKSVYLEIPSHSLDILPIIESWPLENSHLQGYVDLILAENDLLDLSTAKHNLSHCQFLIQAAATMAIKQHTIKFPELTTKVNSNLQTLLNSSEIEAVICGLKIIEVGENEADIPLLISLLAHPHNGIKRKAALAFARCAKETKNDWSFTLIDHFRHTTDKPFKCYLIYAMCVLEKRALIKNIITQRHCLSDQEVLYFSQGIEKYAFDYLPFLIEVVNNQTMHYNARINAAQILDRLSRSEFLKLFLPLVLKEIEKASEYDIMIHQDTKLPHPRISPSALRQIFKDNYFTTMEFIILLIGIYAQLPSSMILFRGILSKNEKTHSNAIETLEKACPRKVFSLLSPLIDGTSFEARRALYEKKQAGNTIQWELIPRKLLQIDRHLRSIMNDETIAESVLLS